MEGTPYADAVDRAAFISQGTKDTYRHALTMLMADLTAAKRTSPPPSFQTALFEPEKTGAFIRGYYKSLHTQKTVVTALLAVLKYSGLKKENRKLFSRWYEIFKPIMRQLKQRERDHVASDRQKAAILPWSKVLAARDRLKPGSDDHVLLSMYTSIPPRRQLDYYRVFLYTDPNDKPDRTETHMHLAHPKGAYLLVTRFKTDKFYRPFYTKLPPDLLDTVQKSLASKPRAYLFVGANGEPFHSSNTFAKYTNHALKRIFDSPHMSVNILRHASATFINNKPDVTFGERERHAYQMGHSINKQISYEIKSVEKTLPDSLNVGECYQKTSPKGRLKAVPCITGKTRDKLQAAAALLKKQLVVSRKPTAA